MLTFEFPDPGKADYFVARLQRERHEYVKSPSGKVVDVVLPKGDDPSVIAIVHDYLVLLAAHFGAYDRPAAPERLYTLHTWGQNEDPRDHEVTIVTLAAFSEDNPYLALAIIQTIEREGSFTGGGGAQPSWRITRTPFVGKREG